MPAVAIVLIMLMGYQLFFRFESWPSDKHDGVIYERDNLSGDTRIIKPGEHVSPLARLLGDGLAQQVTQGHRPPDFDEAFNFSMIDVSKQQSPNSQNTNTPAKTIEAPKTPVSSGAPVPANSANPKPSASFMSQNLDLNGDNETEEVIQRITANDGLVDISIVRHGKEIFYGRGKQLQVLSNRQNGWLDIGLDTGEKNPVVYSFNPGVDSYMVQTAKR